MILKGVTRALLHTLEQIRPGAGIRTMRSVLEKHVNETDTGFDAARALLEELVFAERAFTRMARKYLQECDAGRVNTPRDADRYIHLFWRHYRREIRPRKKRLIKLLRTL